MLRRPSPAVLALLAVLSTSSIAQDAPVFIRQGRVHVRPGVVVESASVLVEGGKIKSVGKDLTAPEGATVVDATGLDVYPSFIDPLNDALLETYPSVRGLLGGADRALDLFDRFADPRRAELRRHGIGVVGLGAAVNGSRSGVAAVIGTEPDAEGAPVVYAADRFVQVDVAVRQRANPGAPLLAALGPREAAIRGLEEALDGAKKYREAWEKYEKDYEEYRKKLAEGVKTESRPAPEKREERPAAEEGGPPQLPEGFRDWPREKQREWTRENMRRRRGGGGGSGPSNGPAPAPDNKLKPPEKPKTEPDKEALVKVLKRETPLWVGAEWRQDLGWLLDFAEKRDVKLAVLGASEASFVIERLKAQRAVVVLPPPVSLDEDPLGGAPEDLCRTLAKAGVPFTFATAGRPEYGPGGLRFVAALAVGRGLSEDDALAATTLHAARALGLEKTLGSIEAGKVAHLMVVRGSPFDLRAPITATVQGGRVTPGEK